MACCVVDIIVVSSGINGLTPDLTLCVSMWVAAGGCVRVRTGRRLLTALRQIIIGNVIDLNAVSDALTSPCEGDVF